MSDSKDQDYVKTFREFVQTQFRSLNTTTFVVVENVDENREATVSLKSDSNVVVDSVPIASLFARDGVGVVVPIEQGDEGLLLHPKEPIDEQLESRGESKPDSKRRFELEDAVLFPMLWTRDENVPDHEPGELVVEHDSGTRVSIGAQGDVTIESGGDVVVDASSVTLGDPAAAAAALTEQAEIQYVGGGDNSSTMTADIVDPGSTDTDVS